MLEKALTHTRVFREPTRGCASLQGAGNSLPGPLQNNFRVHAMAKEEREFQQP
jgi:hypothetical protein